MSSDAKIWQADNDDWCGLCDAFPGRVLRESVYGLRELMEDLEFAMNKPQGMRWVFHVYPDGKAGLRGFAW